MKSKSTLEKRVRGWFPQEPKFPSRTSPIQLSTKHKPLPKRMTFALTVIGFLAPWYALLFGFSTVQIILTAIISAFGVALLIFRKTAHNTVSRVLKYCLIFTLAFIILFGCIQFYVFETSGYPSTTAPQMNYQTVTNASLTQYLDGLEQSENFRLMQANHVGTLTFQGLELHAYSNGWLSWTFYANDTNSRVTMGNTAGQPYYTNADSLFESLFPRQTLRTQEYTLQATAEAFQQIDTIGLDTFLNHAMENYKNQPNATAQLNALNIYIGYDDVGGYQGLTVTLSPRGLDHDSRGTPIYPGLFEAEFKPDGTLLSYKSLS